MQPPTLTYQRQTKPGQQPTQSNKSPNAQKTIGEEHVKQPEGHNKAQNTAIRQHRQRERRKLLECETKRNIDPKIKERSTSSQLKYQIKRMIISSKDG
jgi:23S rRNA maturation-related 3'-5' exoribonuclease YhaM